MTNREIFIDKLRQLSKEEMLERYIALLNTEKLVDYVADLEAKLAESEEDLQVTKESLYASREYLEELKSEKWGLEKALELAVKELDDAKDMLRECNKNEWASLLNTSADYFKTRGKEVENDRK